MRMRTLLPWLVLVLLAAVPSPAAAQSTPGGAAASAANRVFVAVSGTFQMTSNDFSDSFTFPTNAEEGRADTDYTLDGGIAFDIAGGYLFSGRFGFGVGFTRFSRDTPAAVSGTIPHPFFFDQPRSFAGTVEDLKREESAVELQARFALAAGPRLQIMLFGGPSFFTVRQGLVEEIEYSEAYPYDEVTFDGAVTSTVEESAVGVHVGADVAYFFTRHIGVGGGVKYARATVELPSAGSGTIEVKAGGLHVGGGLRLRF